MRTAQPFLFAGLLTLATSTCLTAGWVHTTGLTGQRVNALTVDGTQLFAATQDSGVFLSRDGGTTWLAVNAGLTDLSIRALAIDGAHLFAGAQDSGMFRSSDSGVSWHAINVGIRSFNIQALASNDSFLFVGTNGGGVCRSSDSGDHWLAVNMLGDGTELHFLNIFSFGVTSEYVFIGTHGGSAFRSADNGTTWYMVTNGMAPPSEGEIPYAFAVGDTFIFAGTAGGGVLRAKDSARVWFPVNAGLPDTVTALVLTGDSLFAATQDGVFLSSDNGDHWTSATDGIADTAVFTFAVSGANLLAGTSNGVWRLPLGEPSVAVQRLVASGSSASGMELTSSSPSMIRYSTGSEQRGVVSVFAPSGMTLFSRDVYGAGTTTWNSSNRASGIYIARLNVGARILTKTIVLPK